MDPTLLVLVYCAAVVCASLLGGWLPSAMRLTHTRMQLMMSLVAGFMLGVSLFHLLPDAVRLSGGSLDAAIPWLMAGLLGMFFLMRTFHFHQHDPGDIEGRHHDHDHHGPADSAHGHDHRLSWLGVAVGLSLHTAIDGVALAASVLGEAGHADAPLLLGLPTFLAVLLHKPLDAMSITSLMAAGGWAPRTRQLVNASFAMMCPLGAALCYFGLGGAGGTVVGCALAFSAGVFLCISLADLLPEVQFHTHDRLRLSLALLLGVGLAYLLVFLPHGHAH